jgi:hypothetical protein
MTDVAVLGRAVKADYSASIKLTVVTIFVERVG